MAAALTSSLLTTALLAGSLGATAAGTGLSMAGAKANTEAQQKAERLRQSAMEMDARRRSTEIIRNQQRARAMALTTATSQGASEGSGLQGGYGQISGMTGTNLTGVSGNLELGRGMFAANQDAFRAQSMMATGQGLSSLGSSTLGSLDAFGRLSRNFAPNNFGYGRG